MTKFNDLIKEAKTNANQMHLHTGIPLSTLHNYKTGNRKAENMPLMYAGLIADYLQISIDDLLKKIL